MATVTAVIPHWNRRELLEKLLNCLRAQSHPVSEILVVDNGSEDDSVAVAEAAGARVIRMPANVGFSRAVNRGVEEAHTEWVAIINNDVSFGPEWLETLVSAAAPENCWFATGKVVKAHDPGTIDATFDAVCRGACAWRCGEGRPDGPAWSEPRRISFVPFTAALFRRALFDRVGPLDEQFESYLEDVEFGMRCAVAGLGGIYVPRAVTHHVGSATLGRWHSDTVRRIARNQVLFAAKHFQRSPLWPILAAQLLWGMLAFRHGEGMAYVRGKLEGLRAARKGRWPSEAGQSEKARTVVEEAERQIWELQTKTGFDWYWKAYFWSTGGGR